MSRGVALILALVIGGTILTLGVIATRIVYNNLWTSQAMLLKEKGYWLASGGLEWGEARLRANPDWFTDLPVLTNKKEWLLKSALGETIVLAAGQIKVVREKGAPIVYSVGSFASARVVMRGELNSGKIERKREL
ncbi:MAG: hypothetical protein WCW67_01320 [Candidatus Margulisiibacteriota bacterium]